MNQFFRRNLPALHQFDKGARQFARTFVRLSDSSCNRDLRVSGQDFLDRFRINIVAASNDLVLFPAGDPEIAFGITPAKIAGAKKLVMRIQVSVSAGVRIGLARIHARARDADLADLAHLAFGYDFAVLVETKNPCVNIWKGEPNGTNSLLARGGLTETRQVASVSP